MVWFLRSIFIVSSTSSGISSSSERIELASLASRAPELRSLNSIKLMRFGDGDETPISEVMSEVVESESELKSRVPLDADAIEAISTSLKSLRF